VRTASARTIRGAAAAIGLSTWMVVVALHMSFDDAPLNYFLRHVHEGDKPLTLAFALATFAWWASLFPGISDRTTARLAWASLTTVVASALVWCIWASLLRERLV
jgi:hypothetical protein